MKLIFRLAIIFFCLGSTSANSAVIVEHLFSEAASGSAPTSVADSSGNSRPLSISYGSSAASWASNGEGKYLDFTAAAGSSAAYARVATNVGGLGAAINGLNKLTLVVKVQDITNGIYPSSPIAEIATAASDQFGLYRSDISLYVVTHGGSEIAAFYATDSGSIAVVVDTTQATAADRIKVYERDGSTNSAVTLDSYDAPALNSAISVSSDSSTWLIYGNSADLSRSLDGGIKYGRLDNTALTQSEVYAIFDAITSNDDASTLISGTSVNPSAGSLTFSGATSAVVKNTIPRPAESSLALTGATPAVSSSGNQSVSVAAASFALTGVAPTITQQTFTWYSLPAPGGYDSNSILAGQTYPAGSWLRVISDFAHIIANYAVGPLQNNINDYATAETGYTGSDSATYQIKTPAGSTSNYTVTATISGSIGLGPATASLSLGGSTSTVTATNNKSVAPNSIAMIFTGATPTLSGINQSASPSPASLNLAGATSTVTATANQTVTPTTRAVAFTGATSSVSVGGNVSVSPSTAALAFASLTPQILINGQVVGGGLGTIRSSVRNSMRPSYRNSVR